MTTELNQEMIIFYRLAHGYSQSELAQKASVSRLTINLIESGKTKMPHPRTIKSICDALGISALEILKNTNRNEMQTHDLSIS